MANAILMNGKASEPVEVANGIIEQFYSDTDVISAKNFIDFLNKGTFDIGNAISLASSNSSGLISPEFQNENYNIYHNNYWDDNYNYYNNNHNLPYVYLIGSDLVFLLYTQGNTSTTNYSTAILFQIVNNTITVKNAKQIPGRGTHLKVVQMSETKYVVISGGYYTSTATAYYPQATVFNINTSTKTWSMGTSLQFTSGYYYYQVLVGAYKTDSTHVIVFLMDGNNGGQYFPCNYMLTINSDNTITSNGRYLNSSYSANQAQYMYEVLQLADNKYVEVTHYNYPLINIVTTNAASSTRSSYLNLNGTAYTNKTYCYQKVFKYKNWIYIPYYNGSTWTIGSVNCSGSSPTIGTYQALPAAGTNKPIIQQVSENELVAVQYNGTVGYACYMKLNEKGGFDTSSLVLTVNEFVSGLKYLHITNEECGFVLFRTYQYNGTMCVPIAWRNGALSSGKPQYWSLSDANAPYYFTVKKLDNHNSVYLHSELDGNYYHNNFYCDAIYQNGINLIKSNSYCLTKVEQFYNKNLYHLMGAKVNNTTHELILLYRISDTSNVNYRNLYIVAIKCLGGKLYVSAPTKVAMNSETSSRNMDYGNLLQINDTQYIALFNHSNNNLYAKAIKFNPRLVAIPSDETGVMAGITVDQCTPDVQGRIFITGGGK